MKRIEFEVTTPPDKSITHRAIMFASLAEGVSVIENYLSAQDCMSTLGAFIAMGVKVEKTSQKIVISGAGIKGLKAPAGPIDAGNSGTTVRLLSGILAGQDFKTEIFGDASLSKRPMKRVIEPLLKMGALFSARDDNYLPMTIQGNPKLVSIDYKCPVASAQVKSCVLLAGLQAEGKTTFTEPERSRDHTELMLKAAGADIKVSGLSVTITGPGKLKPQNIKVPGDISSAAFFMVLGAAHPNAKITIKNVGINPTRDGILKVMKQMNARIEYINKYTVSGEQVADISVESSTLSPCVITPEMVPGLIDEIPIIALMATQAGGRSVISGAGELRVKESDRLKAVAVELAKMGAKIEEKPDGLIIDGPIKLTDSDAKDYDDHRIAMMIAVARRIAGLEEKRFSSVSISFPTFYDLIKG